MRNKLKEMRIQELSRTRTLLTFKVIVSALLLIQCISFTQGNPSPAPIMTFNGGNNNEGAYSLFPNEDLRTGRKNHRLEDELRPIRDRNQILSEAYRDRDRYREPYRDRDGRNNRFRDEPPVSLQRISNYRITRPLEKYNQILFDDERLNYPSVRIPNRDRDRDRSYDRSRYPERDPGTYFTDYRDRNLPHDKHRLTQFFLPVGSPRHLSGFRPAQPIIPEPKYPPRPYSAENPPPKSRIHIFDPASKSFKESKPLNSPPKFGDNVKPGRLLIPGFNSLSNEEPGPNVFLNHEEYLDFHTKKALVTLNAEEKKKAEKDAIENEKKSKAKHLLFSPNIGGLRPPVPNSSSEEEKGDTSSSSENGGGSGKPELRNQKVKGVIINPLPSTEQSSHNKDQHKSIQIEEGNKNGQQQHQQQHQLVPSQPLRLRGIPNPNPRSSSSLLSSPQDVQQFKGIKTQLGTDVHQQQQQKTIHHVGGIVTNNNNNNNNQKNNIKINEQNLNQNNGHLISSSPVVTQPTLIQQNDNSFFSLVNHNPSPFPHHHHHHPNFDDTPHNPVTETITFTPNTFLDFNGHQHQHQQHEFHVPTFSTELDNPPLIFLESQDGRKLEDFNKIKNNNNMIFVRRVKTNGKHLNGTTTGTNIQSQLKSTTTTTTTTTGIKKFENEKDIETTMKVHKSQADSFESFTTSNDFNLQKESMSSTGVVSKVHAHISNCPKLHGAAEVICDVHIRKRHGSPNPQLIVGWKRKFHNATQPDIVLALNKTLAYEEDFHDKFNVTLAPGISPMLRSVLLIRHVAPPDTGNYQCEVTDGENRLKSDTLLFLCH